MEVGDLSVFKILIFYPHNPANPQHGSHLRALQQIQGLQEIGQVYLASADHTSDTKWPDDLEAVTRILGIKEIFIFERSSRGLTNRVILMVTWLHKGLDAILRRTGMHRLSNCLRSKGRGWLMQRWFGELVSSHGIDLVVINYTLWAWLVAKLDRRMPKVLELHDLISVSQYLQQAVKEQLVIRNQTVILRPHARSIGYVTTATQLPVGVRQRLTTELAEIRRFNLVWSIADRDSNLIHELDASIRVDTILPNVETYDLRYAPQEYALLPIGPNIFNTYSLLKFFQEIEPGIAYSDDARILITGRSWPSSRFAVPQRVEYLGMVDNYQTILGSARFVIAPTAVGTGQQIKIFEALASGIPVVCYRASVPEKLDSKEYGVVCVNTAKEFAEAVGRMWRDELFYQGLLSGAKESAVRNSRSPNAYARSVNKLKNAKGQNG